MPKKLAKKGDQIKKRKKSEDLTGNDESLRKKRIEAIEAYLSFLNNINTAILYQIESYQKQMQRALLFHLASYALITISSLGLLIVGLFSAWSAGDRIFRQYFGASIVFTGIILIFIVLSKSPIAGIRRGLIDLGRLNVILTGYIRQVNQIDASLIQVLYNSPEQSIEEMDKTLVYLRRSVGQVLDEVDQTISEFRE
jgi:hypothetical protein